MDRFYASDVPFIDVSNDLIRLSKTGHLQASHHVAEVNAGYAKEYIYIVLEDYHLRCISCSNYYVGFKEPRV